VQPGSSDATLEDLGRGIESCIYWSAVLGPFDANDPYVATMLETRSGFNGRFPVEVRVNYDDLPTPSDDLHRFEVVIPEHGANIEVRPVDRPLWRDLDPTWDRDH
jgi:hypothetical protein